MINCNTAYDIFYGENGITVLDIAVPGFRKDMLRASLENGYLKIESTNTPVDSVKYRRREIPTKIMGVFKIDPTLKLDMITCDSGLLRVLLSPKIELPDTNDIPIQ